MNAAQIKYVKERLAKIYYTKSAEIKVSQYPKEKRQELFDKGAYTVINTGNMYSVVFDGETEYVKKMNDRHKLIEADYQKLLDQLIFQEPGAIEFLEAFRTKEYK